MTEMKQTITRRDFLRGAAYATAAATIGLPSLQAEETELVSRSRVVLIRDQAVIGANDRLVPELLEEMLSRAMFELFGTEDAASAWKLVCGPEDTVGIKTNVWGPLPTPVELEQAIKAGVMSTGVPEAKIDIADRGVLRREVFQKATVLINVRPMRTHHWSGVGGLLKNHIMFTPRPPDYHDNSCADLAKLWELPIIKGKTRLNILVMLTPLFHGVGPHHFDSEFTWPYKGLLVGVDPVAVDAVGLRIIQAQRNLHFGEERPLKPPAHHIALADVRHHLGQSKPERIELIKLGWQEGVLI